jgi:hypothetical protein
MIFEAGDGVFCSQTRVLEIASGTAARKTPPAQEKKRVVSAV